MLPRFCPLPALCLAVAVGAADGPAGAGRGAPGLPPDAERLSEDRYRLGKVIVDLGRHEVSCPGKVNMRRGAVEYLAVAHQGKRHESVLVLDVRPLHLQLGLILLGMEPGGGIRRQGDTQAPSGSPVRLRVEWSRGGRKVAAPASELAWDQNSRRPMPDGAWVFTGSATDADGFVADRERSLVALFRDPAAIVNNSLPEGADDTVYKVNERIIPPLGTPVTLVASPGEPAVPGG